MPIDLGFCKQATPPANEAFPKNYPTQTQTTTTQDADIPAF